MKGLVLAVALTAAIDAHAQGSGSEPALLLILGPPALISAALDVVLLSTLVPQGHAGRGRSISTMVFSAVDITFSVICLILGLTSGFPSTGWIAASASALALGVGSMSLGIYGMAHPEPEPDPEPPPNRERLIRPNPQNDFSPQLFMLPLGFSL